MKTTFLFVSAVIGFTALTVLQAQPTIVRQPTDTVTSVSGYAQFQVVANTPGDSWSFQWWFKDAALDAALNPSAIKPILRLTNVTANMAGDYWLVVTDTTGSAASDKARLTVDPTFEKIIKGSIVEDSEISIISVWWDYDNDGDLDVVVPRMGDQGPGPPQSFYRNNGDGTFTKVVDNAVAQAAKQSTCGSIGDVNNDGRQEILISNNNFNSAPGGGDDVFRYAVNGVFSAMLGEPWQREQDSTWSASLVDVDGDGWLDVFGRNRDRSSCLYRQTPYGFVKLTATQAGSILNFVPNGYNAAWLDYDGDGDLDLLMDHEQGSCSLHENNGNGFFVQVASPSLDKAPASLAVWADVNNDGGPELFIPGQVGLGAAARPSVLYRRVPGQDFEDIAGAAGVAAPVIAFHAGAGDFDNDGWLDLFVLQYFGSSTNLLFRNRGDGTFESLDVGSPIRDGSVRHTATWVDYDNDGFLDLFVACGDWPTSPQRNQLYHNNLKQAGNANHWLKLKLNGQAANRSGIGARIRVKAMIGGKEVWQVREVAGDSLSLTCPGLIAHLGLGDATKADVVRVEWPSGNVQEMTDVTPDQALTITEVVGITPARPTSSLGGSVTLNATGTGTWQWYHNGVALEGKTSNSLRLDSVKATDAGRYSVVVTSETGSVTHHVFLVVDTQFEKIPMGTTGQSWGCAWGDYDNDGYPDLVVAEGAGTTTATLSLYRNDRNGGFIKVTAEEAGDIVNTKRSWGSLAWGDYDSDGWLDLIVSDNSMSPRAALWRNLGNGRFEDATNLGSFLTDTLWCAPIWGDFTRDGRLDLAVANHWAEASGARNLLYFNSGDGTFRKETQGAWVAYQPGIMVEGGSAADWDGDGDLDLIEAHHTGIAMYENDGTGGFTQLKSGAPVVNGLCITVSWADYDNDGRLDAFIAVYNGTSQLLHNDGGGQWTKIPLGLAVQTGAGMWADYDNDGDLDLYVTRGQGNTTNNLLYANNGDGTFTLITRGGPAADLGQSAGCAWADYDNNGFLDLFVSSNPGVREMLYRNYGNSNHWVALKLAGTASNRAAIGAKVKVHASVFGKTYWQLREIGGANRHQNDLRAHFGLGNATKANQVRIEWPSGFVQRLNNVAADQVLTVWEPPFLQAAMLANGGCQLTIKAEPNRAWRIEASRDLKTWETLATETHAEASFQYTDTAAAGVTERFYRIVGN